jgi:hypothetical protein
MTFEVTGNNTTVYIYLIIDTTVGNETQIGPLTQKYFSQVGTYSRSATTLPPGTYKVSTYAYISGAGSAACTVDHVDSYALGNLSG